MYDAFISYSHADKYVATSMQRGLHRFAKPWYALRAAHTFRDEADLPAGSPMWRVIEGALLNSRYLLLIASPSAAASHGVRREVDFWLAHRSPESVMVAVVAGNLSWDRAVGRFSTLTDCLPPALVDNVTEEPLWCDLKWAPGQSDLRLADFRFREAICRVAARLRGVTPSALDGEDIRQRRRTRAAIAAGTVVVALSAVTGLIQNARAKREHAVATSRELASQAIAALGFDPELALRLSISAAETAHTQQAESALREATVRIPLRQQFVSEVGTSVRAAFVSDKLLVAAGRALVLFSIASGEQLATYSNDADIDDIRVGPDYATVSVVSGNVLTILEPATLRLRGRVTLSAKVAAIDYAPTGVAIVVATADGSVSSVSVNGGTTRILFHVAAPTALRFDHSGQKLAVVSEGRVETWDASRGHRLATMPEHREGYRTATFTSDDKQLVGFGSLDNKSIDIWDPATGQRQGGYWHRDSALVVALSPADTLVASADETSPDVALWDRRKPDAVAMLKGHGARVHTAEFSPNGAFLATAGADRNVIIWDVQKRHVFAELSGHRAPIRHLEFDRTGRHVVTVAANGEVKLWELSWLPVRRIQGGPEGPRINYDDANVVSVGFAGRGRFIVVAGVTYTSVFNRQTGEQTDSSTVRVRFSNRAESWGLYEQAVYDAHHSRYQHGWWWVDAQGKLLLTPTPRLDDCASAIVIDRQRILLCSNGTVSSFTRDEQMPRWEVPVGHYVSSLSFDEISGTLFVSGDSESLILDAATGAVLDELARQQGYGTKFESSRGELRSLLDDVFLWRRSAGSRYSVFGGGGPWGSVVTCNAGGCAVGRNDGTIVLLDTTSGAAIAELRGHRQRIRSLQFTQDARFLASASADGTTRVWDVGEHHQLTELRGHTADVSSAAFSVDESTLVTGALGADVAVYDIPFTADFAGLLALARGMRSRISASTLTVR